VRRQAKSEISIIRNNTEILPGWTLTFDEVSNNVYKVNLTDKWGRQGGTTDSNLDKAIVTCEYYAFDIERQISKNWNKFLYDACLMKIDKSKIIEAIYHDEAFGSWYVTTHNKRIVFDGRDFVLLIQFPNGNDWIDKESIKIDDLTYDLFIKAIS